ncbi:hypothetical protein ACLB1E_24225 [Escherichia coli]
MHSQTPRAEGGKSHRKGFQFSCSRRAKSYFIPPPQMKKVMHGDRIIAVIHSEERESQSQKNWLNRF